MRVLLALLLVGCAEPFREEHLGGDAGLRDGEMPPELAQEWCSRWICEQADGGIVRRSCGGRDWYDCGD